MQTQERIPRMERGISSLRKRTPPPPSPPTIPKASLLRWNVAMFFFHSMFAIVTLSLGRLDLSGTVYKTVLGFERKDVNDTTSGWDIVPLYEEGGSIPLTVLTAIFFLLSSLFHLLNATLLREFYLSEIENCRTPTRWIEYFFSAPVMILVISFTLGVRERSLLLSLCCLVAITMPFGYWTEVISRPGEGDVWTLPFRSRIFPWVVGHLPQVIVWSVLLSQFYERVVDLDFEGGKVSVQAEMPWFVHLILWGELVLFFSFGVASLVSQLGPPSLFYRGEILFQFLSLFSKGLLGMLLLSNVLMLSSFSDIY